MRLNIITSQNKLPVKKGYMISLIIKNLKGYKAARIGMRKKPNPTTGRNFWETR